MQNNSDKFDHLISLSAIKCTEEDAEKLNELDTSDVVFDPSYYKKRNKIINKYRRAPSLKSTKSVMLRLAAAIMIVIMIGGALIGCVPSLRKAIFDAIVKWYDRFVTVSYDNEEGREKETGYEEESTLQIDADPVVPKSIENIRKPRDLPEGVWEDLVIQSSTGLEIDYYRNEDYLFSFSQMLLKPNDNRVDNEDVDITYVKINSNDGTVVEYENKKEIILFWCDGEYSYRIVAAECDFETLIKYAESVK
ncbi:MAG: DUF4367 domain-containing protein [Clostridia bacterium]|nr:DUF4367 domain-containing protein [Clostridia bacterium]